VLRYRVESLLARLQAQLTTQAQVLNTVSPLATLQRGYAIVHDDNNNIVRDYRDVKPGDDISARVANGMLECTVNRTTTIDTP